jgi:hypothetical protein
VSLGSGVNAILLRVRIKDEFAEESNKGLGILSGAPEDDVLQFLDHPGLPRLIGVELSILNRK